MMDRKKKYFSLLCGLLTCLFSWAHHPDEISYLFQLDNGTLRIHLTQKSILDLVEYLHPHLKNEAQIALPRYERDIQHYFSDYLQVTIGQQTIGLNLVEMDLAKHNAAMVFELLHLPRQMETIEISMKTFTHMYGNAKNHILVHSPNQKYHFQLDNQNTSISAALSPTPQNQIHVKATIGLIGSVCLLFVLGHAVHRKKTLFVKPWHHQMVKEVNP